MSTRKPFVSIASIEEIIQRDTYLSHRASYISYCLERENYAGEEKGEVGYYVDLDGDHVGLGQFNAATWNSLIAQGRLSYPFSSAGEVEADLHAIAALYDANKTSFHSTFDGEFTNQVAYLYHNQGAPAAQEFIVSGSIRDGYGAQSDSAYRTFNEAREQLV